MPPVNFRLLLVTDRHLLRSRSLTVAVEQAVESGVPAVQLRERDLPTDDLVVLAERLHQVTAPRGVPLMVNDRVDLVLALNLEGVHLRSSSVPVSVARRLVGPHRFVGASAHSLEEVRQASEQGADYVVFGPVYDTPSKRPFGPPLGVSALAAACHQSRIPVFAIGGMTSSHVHTVRRSGAHGVAVMGAILSHDDVEAATKELLRVLHAETPT